MNPDEKKQQCRKTDYEKTLMAGTRPVKIIKDGEIAKGLLA